MAEKMTAEELWKWVSSRAKKDKNGQLRIVRLRTPGRDMTMAHLIGTSDREIYQNLGLHIGVHEGEDHTGETIGIMKFTPWECTVPAADISLKSADVEIGFLDRFNGTVIILGRREEVRTALEGVRAFFKDDLHFHVCDIEES
jgi:ethanolamine utilization protein EutS